MYSIRCAGNYCFIGVTMVCWKLVSSFRCVGNYCFSGVNAWCAGNSFLPSGVLVIPVFQV